MPNSALLCQHFPPRGSFSFFPWTLFQTCSLIKPPISPSSHSLPSVDLDSYFIEKIEAITETPTCSHHQVYNFTLAFTHIFLLLSLTLWVSIHPPTKGQFLNICFECYLSYLSSNLLFGLVILTIFFIIFSAIISTSIKHLLLALIFWKRNCFERRSPFSHCSAFLIPFKIKLPNSICLHSLTFSFLLSPCFPGFYLHHCSWDIIFVKNQ